MTLCHPLTGELIDESDITGLLDALAAMEEPTSAAWRIRRHIAETTDWSGPPPNRMSERQMLALRCPRCGERYKA